MTFPFPPLELESLIQIGLSLGLGGAIGLEREARGRAAGLRTMMLVCLGSTLVMIVSGSMAQPGSAAHDPAVIRVDPARIAAGVVTGIGFLGAGVVVRLGDLIRGVTTAASIWLAAVLGIAIGAGHYTLAIASTGAALIVLWLFQFFERFVPTPLYRRVRVTVGSGYGDLVHEAVLATFRRHRIRIMDMAVELSGPTRAGNLTYSVRSSRELAGLCVVRDVLALEGVESARWGA